MASHMSNGKTEGRLQSCAQCCMEEGMGAAGRLHRHPRLPGSQGRPPREGEGARAFSRPVRCSFPRFFTKVWSRGLCCGRQTGSQKTPFIQQGPVGTLVSFFSALRRLLQPSCS